MVTNARAGADQDRGQPGPLEVWCPCSQVSLPTLVYHDIEVVHAVWNFPQLDLSYVFGRDPTDILCPNLFGEDRFGTHQTSWVWPCVDMVLRWRLESHG